MSASSKLTAAHIQAFAIDPKNRGTLYAGSVISFGGGGIFKSTNFGRTWVATLGFPDLGVKALAIDPITSATLYAGAYGGIVKSTDDKKSNGRKIQWKKNPMEKKIEIFLLIK